MDGERIRQRRAFSVVDVRDGADLRARWGRLERRAQTVPADDVSPPAATSTSPDGRFVTHPLSPSRRASSRTNQRKPTPCTRPLIRTRIVRTATAPILECRGEARSATGAMFGDVVTWPSRLFTSTSDCSSIDPTGTIMRPPSAS